MDGNVSATCGSSSFFLRTKRLAERLPRPLGRWLAIVPFSWRFGPVYNETKRDLERFLSMSPDALKDAITRRVMGILDHANRQNPFYREFYLKAEFDPESVRAFDDISGIPVLSKEDLRAAPLETRSQNERGRLKTNTGGSSGKPLDFYLDRRAFGREWAHMHVIWAKLGYRQTDLKLTLRGRNLGRDALRYNAVHHEFNVNATSPFPAVADAVEKVAGEIKFLHGYPSAIYEFVRRARDERPVVLDRLRKGLKGVLFGSEYPAPVYRDLIEKELATPTLSWYGHSEMAALAYECERYVYRPFHSYGFCEAIPDGMGAHRLLGTSYDNRVHPFVRYDTEDLVEPTFEDGLLATFTITKGRTGDFVLDADGNRISLTALIFGRHHRVFDNARFIQVRPEGPGRAVLVVTTIPGKAIGKEEVLPGFDSSHVAIDFSVEIRSEPYRTQSGKTPLIVKEEAPV